MALSKKGIVLATAAAALMTTGCVERKAPEKAKEPMVRCSGINSCKGTSACKTANSACKGQNSCKGTGFIMTSKSECNKSGGEII